MKKLENRVERELVDILYSIIISNPSPITIKLNGVIEVRISKVMNLEYLFPPYLYSVVIINEQNILAQTILTINPYEAGYTIQYLNFDKKVQGLKGKRWLVERLKK
jgi:hypothetical protein